MFRNFIGWLFGFNAQMRNLHEQLKDLSWDTAFGMYTRPGLMALVRSNLNGEKAVVFVDLDRIHDLNSLLGYSEVDRRVKLVFSTQTRQADVLAARWWSGDEILLVLDCTPLGAYAVMDRLAQSASSQGLSFTCAIDRWDADNDDLDSVVEPLSQKVMADKVKKTRRCSTRRMCA